MAEQCYKPFKPLAKPLGPLDPLPVFNWKAQIIQPENRDVFTLKINDCTADTDSAERSETMCEPRYEPTLGTMMKLVENATPVRIDVKGEEMALTPHRLAMYGHMCVKKMFINVSCELEMELEER